MSQDEIAKSIRVTRQTISNWENNKAAPDYWNLVDLKNYYSISWDDLLGNCDELESLRIEHPEENFGCSLFNPSDILKNKICNLSKEDISSLMHDIIEIDFPKIAYIAIKLKNKGYKILSIYPNGFAIKINSLEKAKILFREITNILDSCFMHLFNFGNIDRSNYDKINEVYYSGYQKSLFLASKELFNLSGTDCYSLYDSYGNSLWHGNTKAECKTVAKDLGISEYEILQCDDFEGIDELE